MKQKPHLLVALMASLALALTLLPAGATAATAGDISVRFFTVDQPVGVVTVDLLDKTKTHTLRMRRGDTQLNRGSSPVGAESISLGYPTLRPGDVIEIYRPAIPTGAPTVAPVDTYTIPAVSLNYADGVVSGTVGESTQAQLTYAPSCGTGFNNGLVDLNLVGGGFTELRQLTRGTYLDLAVFNGSGDVTKIDAAVPGETPCLVANADKDPFISPNDPGAATPYQIYMYGFSEKIATTLRLVWKRRGDVVHDVSLLSADGTFRSATQPLPGDQFEIYRPMNAPEPTSVQTLPDVRAIHDADAQLLAIDGPAADAISTFQTYDIAGEEEVSLSLAPVAAGRTLIDFKSPPPSVRPAPGPSLPGLVTRLDWEAPGGTPRYLFLPEPGDLKAPGIRILAGRSIRLSRFKKNIRIRVDSTEAVTGELTLTMEPVRGGSAPLKLAAARVAKGAGTSRVAVRFTGKGRAAVKRLLKTGKKRTAILTLEVKDAAGNATTSAKKIGLVKR